MESGFIEIDVHNMTVEQAIEAIDKKVASASGAVYAIRVIHGFNHGTRIKNAIKEEYSYNRNTKVKGVRAGSNQGITELVLRKFF